jgi:hypothetical protein
MSNEECDSDDFVITDDDCGGSAERISCADTDRNDELWKILIAPSRRATVGDAGVMNPVKVVSSQGEIPVPCSSRGERLAHLMDRIMEEGVKQENIEACAKFNEVAVRRSDSEAVRGALPRSVGGEEPSMEAFQGSSMPSEDQLSEETAPQTQTHGGA